MKRLTVALLLAACAARGGEPEPLAEAGNALAYLPGEGRTDGLIRKAQQAAWARPAAAKPYVELANLFIRRKRETADPRLVAYATEALEAARARAPGDAQVLATTVILLEENHRFAEAAGRARELIAAAPREATGHLLLGDALLEMGDDEGALAAYQRALDLHPDLRSYNRAAYMRWLHGDPDEALQLLDLAFQGGSAGDPEPIAWCWVDVGNLEWHRGAPERAVTAARRALELVPGYLPALGLEARGLAALGRREEAVALLEPVADRIVAEDALFLADQKGDGARAVLEGSRDGRAVALYEARHDLAHEEALRLAGAEMQARPGIYTLDAWALALLRAGRAEEAEAAMARALAPGTPDARLFLHHGLIQLARGDRAGARASLERAAALNPAADGVVEAELRKGLGLADGRDQYALLADVVAIEKAAPGEQERLMAETRQTWQGKRYRWEVAFVPALCRSAASCVVVPFDRARSAEPIVQGWLPRLELDAAGQAALAGACAPHAACAVDIEATLAELVLSPDVPTSVELRDVRLLGARGAHAGERWFEAPPR